MNKDEEVRKVFEETTIQLYSQLYMKLCNCRRDFEELDDLLETKFHLEECPYRRILEQQDVR